MRKVFLIALLSLGFIGAEAQELDNTTAEPHDVTQAFNMDSLIRFAESLIGVPYKYGGCTPDGFDCSGFVFYVYSAFGIELPRSSPELALIGVEVPLDSCRKGDIILFSGRDRKKRPVGHAGIITTEIGEPVQFVHSATSNSQGIIVTSLEGSEYYESRFVKIIRVIV